MRRIEAIVCPHKTPAVLAALAKAGLTIVTVVETLGLARRSNRAGVNEDLI